MESKWIVILIVSWLVIIFGSLAYSDHVNSQCKVAAIAQGMSADNIVKLCKQRILNMKILAKTVDGYMLEATDMEIAQLHGFQTTYDKDYRRNLVHIGYEVDISKLTRNAEFLRTLDDKVITKAQNRFEELAKEMEMIRDQVIRLNLFDKLKQDF